MNPDKKKGILLIIIGICVPLFALPFVSGFDLGKGFVDNYYNTGIRITKDTPQAAAPERPAANGVKGKFDPKQMRIDKIPYRFFFVPTVLLLYIGIILIDRAKKNRPGQNS